MPEAIRLPAIPKPGDPLGDLILNSGGFPVAWYPLGDEGYSKAEGHPLGEGCAVATEVVRNGKRITFQPMRRIRCTKSQWDRVSQYDEDGRRVPVRRFAVEGINANLSAKAESRTHHANIVTATIFDVPDLEADCNYDDLKTWVQSLDDRQNTLYTIGAAGDYAGYNAAIGGGTVSSGDTLQELDGGNYNENVTDNSLDNIQLIADPSNMPRIYANAGSVLLVQIVGGWVIQFHEFDGQGGAANAISFNSNPRTCIINGCICHDATYPIQIRGVQSCLVSNNILYNGSNYGIYSRDITTGLVIHNTSVDCDEGIRDSSGSICVEGNLCFGHGTADYNIPGGDGEGWNVGENDAPGSASVTGWVSTYFENYAGDDFRINSTGQAWLAARFKGWPLADTDYLGNLRKKSTSSPVFYPGAHDPDPLFSPNNYALPAVGDVLSGSGTYGLVTGAENTPTGANIDFPDKANVLTLDTVHGEQGTFDEAARNTDPGVANVKLSTAYKIQNVDLVGTYDPTVTPPSAPTATLGATGVEVDGDAGVTNYVYKRRVGRTRSFSGLGNVSGDGTVAYPTDEGKYQFYAQSLSAGGGQSQISGFLDKYVGGSTKSIHELVNLDVFDSLDDSAALAHVFKDRKTNQLAEILQGRGAPMGSKNFYLCSELGRVSEDPGTDDYEQGRGRLVLYLVAMQNAGESAVWEMARTAEVITQALDEDRTRGDLVWRWAFRGARNTGALPVPRRVMELTYEYDFGAEPGARVST